MKFLKLIFSFTLLLSFLLSHPLYAKKGSKKAQKASKTVVVVPSPPPRVSSQYLDVNHVQSVQMVPGKATLIILPDESVKTVVIGNEKQFIHWVSKEFKNYVYLKLISNEKTASTNVFFHTNRDKYELDLVSSNNHQSEFKILGNTGVVSVQGQHVNELGEYHD